MMVDGLRCVARRTSLVLVAMVTFLTSFTFAACDSTNRASATIGNPAISTTTMVDYIKAAPSLGVVVSRQLQVLDVEAGSPAQRAGIQRGDILTAIGNTTVTSSVAAKQQFLRARAGQSLAVAIRRGGKPMTLEIQVSATAGRPGAPTPTPVPPSEDYI